MQKTIIQASCYNLSENDDEGHSASGPIYISSCNQHSSLMAPSAPLHPSIHDFPQHWSSNVCTRTNLQICVKVVEVDGKYIDIPHRKLTWNLKMNPWKRRFLLKTIIFRFFVSFPGCTFQDFLTYPTHREKENHDSNIPWDGDMLVPWRVYTYHEFDP